VIGPPSLENRPEPRDVSPNMSPWGTSPPTGFGSYREAYPQIDDAMRPRY
jgi:hypothetical protein